MNVTKCGSYNYLKLELLKELYCLGFTWYLYYHLITNTNSASQSELAGDNLLDATSVSTN